MTLFSTTSRPATMVAPDGLLVVDKPTGWTSHDVVARCRRLTGTRKVGHAGTLDPLATGVLVVGVGRATRLLGYLALTTKGYDAIIRLGQSTATDDADGDVVSTADAAGLSREQIEAALSSFRGDIHQVPSSVSAIKVRGERAYARSRRGEELVLPTRRVRISELELRSVESVGDFVDVEIAVECSSGTYIRALARDLGTTLAVGGHLVMLRRNRVGQFLLSAAHDLDELGRLSSQDLPVIPLADAVREQFASYVVDSSQVAAVRNGRQLAVQLRDGSTGAPADPARRETPDLEAADAEPVAVLAPGGRFLALYVQQGPIARPVAVFDPA
jgi:tRNA pseudouridine55 synthase